MTRLEIIFDKHENATTRNWIRKRTAVLLDLLLTQIGKCVSSKVEKPNGSWST